MHIEIRNPRKKSDSISKLAFQRSKMKKIGDVFRVDPNGTMIRDEDRLV
jgi:hypothetical protein